MKVKGTLRFPKFAGRLVPHPAPKSTTYLAASVDATGIALFMPSREVIDEGIAYWLKTHTYMPLNTDCAVMLHTAASLLFSQA